LILFRSTLEKVFAGRRPARILRRSAAFLISFAIRKHLQKSILRTMRKTRSSARGGSEMPLPMKTLREVSVQLGMSEAEIRALVNLNKVRAVFKKSSLMFAPDEIAKIERQRRTLPESSLKSNVVEPVAAPKPAPPKKAPPKKYRPQ
jgi:hypothetical protein